MNRAARIVCVLLGGLIAAGSTAPQAIAQSGEPGIILAQAERGQRPGIFRFLFRNRRQREAAPPRQLRILPTLREAPRQQKAKPRKQRQAEKPRKQRRKRAAAAAAPRAITAVEKAENAKRVMVIGDFMAGALAKGLAEAFAENPNVVVVDATKGDSGLVRADYYDWQAQIPMLVAEQKPDAILALLGANDRQGISTEAGSQALGTDGWRAAYTARVSALADTLKATTKPIFWAGLAPVKSSAMSRDYSTFNGIFREQLESKGMRYVDIWNGFADEEGKYVEAGPDVNGQSVQLRNSDGLNFTRAGQRKLAFFVERELNEILGTAAPQLAAAGPAEPTILEPADQAPRIGPMIPLDALMVAAGGTLSTAAPAANAGVPSQVGGLSPTDEGVSPADAGALAALAGMTPAQADAAASAPLAAAGTVAGAPLTTAPIAEEPPAASGAPTAIRKPADADRGTVAAIMANRLVGDAKAVPPPGRADNFAWPAAPIPVAAPQPVQMPVPAPNAAPSPLSPAAAAPAASVQPAAAAIAPGSLR